MAQIKIENLSFCFDTTDVLHGVNLQIGKGEFVGVMGPNGGGKTTLLKLLMGFLKPSKGKVDVLGKIGYVPQAQKVDRDFPITVKELVLLGALSKCGRWGYPEEVKAEAEALMQRLGLSAHKDQMFGLLSGGMAQKALLARALMADPDVLLLDEPTANIDVGSTAVIVDMLQSLKGKKTIVMVTHDLKTIIERVDRVLCVQGHVSAYLPKDVCEHFALGLYHAPLLGLPANHFRRDDALVVR